MSAIRVDWIYESGLPFLEALALNQGQVFESRWVTEVLEMLYRPLKAKMLKV